MKKVLAVAALAALVVFGCGVNETSLINGVGKGSLALTLQPPASVKDEVAGFKVEVFSGQTLADSKYVTLETSHLPAGFVPDAGSEHDFANALFVLVPGNYHVKTSPMKSEFVPSVLCLPAEADVVVNAGATTTTALVSQCVDADNGGLEVISVLNNNPQILDLTFNPSQFVSTCQNVDATLTAQDPDGDALNYQWTVTDAPPAQSNTQSINFSADSSHYASANDSASLSVTGDMTIEAWVKRTVNSNVYIASKGNSNNHSYFFYIGHWDAYGHKLFFDVSTDGSWNDSAYTLAYSSTDWDNAFLNTWKHIVVVYHASTSTVEFYVDSILETTSYVLRNATTIYDGNAELYVNSYISSEGIASSAGKPLVDELRIWNVARTQTQIQNNYQKELVGNETGLGAYWKFNNSLNDATANGNNLIFMGGGSTTFSTDIPFTGASYSSSIVNNVFSFAGYVPGTFNVQTTACDPFNICSSLTAPIYVFGSPCQP